MLNKSFLVLQSCSVFETLVCNVSQTLVSNVVLNVGVFHFGFWVTLRLVLSSVCCTLMKAHRAIPWCSSFSKHKSHTPKPGTPENRCITGTYTNSMVCTRFSKQQYPMSHTEVWIKRLLFNCSYILHERQLQLQLFEAATVFRAEVEWKREIGKVKFGGATIQFHSMQRFQTLFSSLWSTFGHST